MKYRTLHAALLIFASFWAGCYWQSASQPAAPPAATTAVNIAPAGTSAEDGASKTAAREDAAQGESAKGEAAQGNVELKILDFDGIQKLIASHKGKVVVVDCWSTFCGPCMKEFPGLVELHKKYAPRVACISVSLNYEGIGKVEDQQEDVLAFLKKKGATFDNVLASEDSDTMSQKLEFTAIPVVFVYGTDGKLVKKFENTELQKGEEGFTYEKDVNMLVESLLAQESATGKGD